MIRVSLGLFAGRKTPVVVPVELHDAPPDFLESTAAIFVAGEPIKFHQPHDRMKTLPAGLGQLKELLPSQRAVKVIAGEEFALRIFGSKLVEDLFRQIEVALLLAMAIEQAQGMNHRQV